MTKKEGLEYIEKRRATIINNMCCHMEDYKRNLIDADIMTFYDRVEDINKYYQDVKRSLDELDAQEKVLKAID